MPYAISVIKSHYSAHCLSRSVANLTTGTPEQTHSESTFLDTIGSDHTTSWTAKINLFGVETLFKLDTGAEVTAVSEDTHSALGKPTLLARYSMVLVNRNFMFLDSLKAHSSISRSLPSSKFLLYRDSKSTYWVFQPLLNST